MSAAVTRPIPSSVLELPHGIHPDVPDAIYHLREPGVASKSLLDLVRRSPAHYRAYMDGGLQEESPALIFGGALHCRVFEPERYARTYVAEPEFGDCRFKENKARRDAWREENKARVALAAADVLAIEAMADALDEHPLAALLRDGDREVTLRWRDSETGIECKGRADYHIRKRRACIDLKSTEDARPESFRRSALRFGYHRQEAFYREAFEAIGEPVEHFIFIAIEKSPPYAIAVYALDTAACAKGHASIRDDLRTLAECLSADAWPSYPAGIQSLSLPDWSE